MTKLTSQQCLTLAAVIGDTPMTVISAARLKNGMCDAYVAGTLPDITAALVFDAYCPDEPSGFGTDAEALWHLLKATDGWMHASWMQPVLNGLVGLLKQPTQAPVRYYGDVYHALLAPVHGYPNPAVRLLTTEDVARLAKAPAEVRGNGYETHTAMLTDGIAAGAIVDDNIVAIAHTYAETDLHTDIGVSHTRRVA